jgi:hypothetical protein
MSSSHDEELDRLRWDWDTAYSVHHPGPDVWVAQRRDNRATLTSDTPEGLRDLISADYAAMPVPRRTCGLGCELPYGHDGDHDDLLGGRWPQ